MVQPLRLATAGVGNNISALVQGIYYYRDIVHRQGPDVALPGVTHRILDGFGVWDVEIVAAFDIATGKIGKDTVEAIFTAPNNYPDLGAQVPNTGVAVTDGLRLENGCVGGHARIVNSLIRSRTEVLLYSLPTGLQWALDGYARCALEAGAGFINCTPEYAARNSDLLGGFSAKALPLIGDDLASQFGASVVHRTLLALLTDRGLDLVSSYQLNIGGNEDFRNLREHGGSKLRSKINALNLDSIDLDRVEVIPSAGHLAQLRDNKISIINIEGRGWGSTSLGLDVRLKVQDSSNAAGVIIDLVRIAGAAARSRCGGFIETARTLLKSPPPSKECSQGIEI